MLLMHPNCPFFFFFLLFPSLGISGAEKKKKENKKKKKEMAWDRDRAEWDMACAGIPWDGKPATVIGPRLSHIGLAKVLLGRVCVSRPSLSGFSSSLPGRITMINWARPDDSTRVAPCCRPGSSAACLLCMAACLWLAWTRYCRSALGWWWC